MGREIERKYLVKDDSWKAKIKHSIPIKQGYLNSAIERTVRVRISGVDGILTIKGKTENLTREEYEYNIPLSDAEKLLLLCEKPIIEKIRYIYVQNNLTWEIDEFSGENSGLIVAEVELENEDQDFDKPQWLGKEVSDDPRYYNAALISHPFSRWQENQIR